MRIDHPLAKSAKFTRVVEGGMVKTIFLVEATQPLEVGAASTRELFDAAVTALATQRRRPDRIKFLCPT